MKTRIRELRQFYGYNQTELARSIGKTMQAVSKYELDQVEPNIATLIKMANLFNVTIDYLVKRSDYINVNSTKEWTP